MYKNKFMLMLLLNSYGAEKKTRSYYNKIFSYISLP